MAIKNENFIVSKDIEWEAAAPGVQRQILAYNDDTMVVRVSFEAGRRWCQAQPSACPKLHD